MPRVEICILTSGSSPAEVPGHAPALDLAPAPGVAVSFHRPLHRADQRGAFGPIEQESRFTVGDRVGEAAGRARDRRRAVALAVHLVEATGLEARRHEE